jgi:hypothetical protein
MQNCRTADRLQQVNRRWPDVEVLIKVKRNRMSHKQILHLSNHLSFFGYLDGFSTGID